MSMNLPAPFAQRGSRQPLATFHGLALATVAASIIPSAQAGMSAAVDAFPFDAGAMPNEVIAPMAPALDPFSFFVTSLRAMQELSGSSDGFGGDLRFGETGPQAGLQGADKICSSIAERSMPGSAAKQWRAFLSASTGGPEGGATHAIDRVGEGPWYDRRGRLVARIKADLASERPASADQAIKNDLPNEDGVPNHNPDGLGEVDNHHVLTGSNQGGRLTSGEGVGNATCDDWTSLRTDGRPFFGLSWPRQTVGAHWISEIYAPGCNAGVHIDENDESAVSKGVGQGGGYGAIYCFALAP
jgi:hypothetical protein